MAIFTIKKTIHQFAEYLLKWLWLSTSLGLVIGSACALFLWSLSKVTEFHFLYPTLLYFLPLTGIIIVYSYEKYGSNASGGNILIFNYIRQKNSPEIQSSVPKRMAPFIFLSTIFTHLFGGSAGREGTAVQMGGSLAATLGNWWKIKNTDYKILLTCGVAAGFSGVFGTPLTAIIFALEVIFLMKFDLKYLIPISIAAFISHLTCTLWQINHTHYHLNNDLINFDSSYLNWLLISKAICASIIFGLISYLFILSNKFAKKLLKKYFKQPLLHPLIGGLLIIALVYLLNSKDYLGLGVSSQNPEAVTIISAFSVNGADNFSWFWKLIFTVITLSTGFKGGEVTPLFFIGATLGNVIGTHLGVPVELFAALGFIAVFAGATKAPLACVFMGAELFGVEYLPYFMMACTISYFCSGKISIYSNEETTEKEIFFLKKSR